MPDVKSLNYNLTYYDTKVVLELLMKESERLNSICVTSSDEDEIADATEDILKVRGLLERLKAAALEEYGHSVLNFSKKPL
jgi:hypothetical protein